MVEKTPLETIMSWKRARQEGADVDFLLNEKVALLEVEAVRKNLKPTISGLRAWHLFLTSALGIPAEKTLPPSDFSHVAAFISGFTNGNTAANYINHSFLCT